VKRIRPWIEESDGEEMEREMERRWRGDGEYMGPARLLDSV